MAGPDIVARLQLRAEQFSSEGGRAFAEMATRARSTSADIRQTFGTDLAAVGKLAQQALTLPRTKAGALDLSGEIAALRQAAAAADARAIAATELSHAMQSAAFTTKAATEASLRDADAAMVDKRAAEQQSAAFNQRIVQLEAYQVELNRVSSATVVHTRAANDNRVSAEQQRQSTIMLGQQLQDFSVQVVSGQSVVTAFAQQIGQAAFALQGMGGQLAGVAAFLTSGWGIVATVGLTIIAPLTAKILEQNNALGDTIDKLKKDAIQTALTAQAKEIFAKSEEGVAAAIEATYEASQKLAGSQKTTIEQTLADARANLANAVSIRQKTDAELAWAQALLESAKARSAAGGERGDVATQAVQTRERALVDIQKRRLQNSIEIAQAETSINNALVAQERAQAKLMQDPVARTTAEWDAKIAALDDEQKRQGTITAEYKARSRELERQKTLAVEAEQARQSAARKTSSLGSQITGEQGRSILSAAQGYTGARENTASGKATLMDLFGAAGFSKLDPEKTAWCAAFVNAVLAGQGIKGNGNLAARSFLNYGTATSKPEAGDIVVLRTGKTQEHVGFYAGEGKNGRVLVTGGNQTNGQVSTTTFARSQVEAFRRAPTASAAYSAELKANAAAAREAEQEQKNLEAALDGILGKFDPAADAARKYRDELGEIDKLARAGKITPDQELTYVRGAKRDYTAAQTAASDQLLRDTFGDAQVTAALADFDRGVAAGVDILKGGVDDAVTSFGAGLRDAVGGAMDLLGIRINGPLRGLLQPGGIEGQAADIAKSLTEGLKNSKLGISPESIEKLSSALGSALAGASYGQIGGSVFASITGGKQSQLGSSLGGVAGKVAGDALGKTIASTVGGTLGKTLGSAAGPLGAIAGGIVGSVLGGLFRKQSYGNAQVSLQNGSASGGTGSGNNGSASSAASSSATSVASGINRVAEMLGAKISQLPALTIGSFDGKARVALTSTTRSLNFNNFNDSNLKDFGTDGQQAAIEYAIRYSISHAVIAGISQASKTIIQNGSADLESAISKAILIESVPKDLKAMLDPVGAAIDALNLKFQKTVDALKEGGATAEQMADAQRLYDLQLAQVKNSTASASQGLKDFLTSLKIGSNSPYSLRDQEQTAKAALAPYLAQITAGQSIDQSKYQAAAQAYLDIERQLYGSTQAYFDALDAVQAATNKAISSIDNATPIGGSVESPFAKATADSAAATAAAVMTANEMAQDTNALLARLVAAAEANGGSITAGAFIGTQRAFA